ncbi:MAG: cellulase family glycosylhydrolase, partial [Bdellovibrionales bacterium]|nr:cellulase family glycosylhydrolase [Bdellovibrionales bacterium]
MAIQSEGNRLIRTENGAPARLAGVNIQDPLWQRLSPGPRILPHGPLSMEVAAAWGANAVRVPFHPVTIRHAGSGNWRRGLEATIAELDWITLAAQALRLDVVVDFHAIGFPATESTFDFDEAPYSDIYRTTADEIESFWKAIAERYADIPEIVAFELYNEAERDSAFGNANDWEAHASWAENLLQKIIRPLAPNKLAIIGGLHFGYDLEEAANRPVQDINVAYASHPYPHHSQAKSWEQAFGRTSEKLPVLLTEVGFASNGFFGRDHHRGFRNWELELQSYADARALSFFAWNFSASWEPTLLKLGPSGVIKTKADFIPNEAGL